MTADSFPGAKNSHLSIPMHVLKKSVIPRVKNGGLQYDLKFNENKI